MAKNLIWVQKWSFFTKKGPKIGKKNMSEFQIPLFTKAIGGTHFMDHFLVYVMGNVARGRFKAF